MPGNSLFAAVDLGATKTIVFVGECARGRLNLVGHGEYPCSGMQRGIVLDFNATLDSLQHALHAAEKSAGVFGEVRRSYFSISGTHLHGYTDSGVASVAGKTVAEDDMSRARADARVRHSDAGRYLLHQFPQGYRLDGRPVPNPLGREARKIEACIWRMDAAESELLRLTALGQQVGSPIEEFIPASLASATTASTPEERRAGVLVVDMGGSVTDYAAYLDDRLLLTGVIPVGGIDLSREIFTKLDVRADDAETIKRTLARAFAIPEDKKETVLFAPGQGVIGARKFRAWDIHAPLETRLREIFSHIREDLRTVAPDGRTINHVILTGDASSLSGLDRLADQVLGMRCERICDREWKGDPFSDPRYGTAMGVLEIAAGQEIDRISKTTARRKPSLIERYRATGIQKYLPF